MDTLKAATELTESGFDERQAKALARVLNEYAHENLATKQDISDVKRDISDLRTEVKQDITDLRTEVKQDITDLRTEFTQEFTNVRHDIVTLGKDLTIKMGSGLVILATVILAAIRYLN